MATKKNDGSAPKKEKTSQKRKKEETINAKVSKAKLTKEDAIDFLTRVVMGQVKDFTGLPPSLETRMKAMDRLMPLIQESESTIIPESIKIVVDDRTDPDRLARLENEVLGNVKSNSY